MDTLRQPSKKGREDMVGFPGLGIPDFEINSKIFPNAGFSVAWYGLIIAVGFFLATLYAMRRAPGFGFTADDIIDMLILAVPAAVVGARLYYVAFDWGSFKHDLTSIFRIWDGGIAIYGAVIGAVLAAALFCWSKHFSIGAMLDLGGLGLLIGQAIGRWGNFFNKEVYGSETTLPWRMRVDGLEVHPLFFYEFLWNALGFVLLHKVSKKRKFNGQIFLLYVAWYGLGRGFLEGMRVDYYALTLGGVRVSQLLAIISCVLALLIVLYQLLFRSHDESELLEWVSKRNAWLEAHPEKKPKSGKRLKNPVLESMAASKPGAGEEKATEEKTEAEKTDSSPERQE